MNKRTMQKWVKALRSGKYNQGTSYLHHLGRDTYCCLGVACDLGIAQKNEPGTFVQTDFLSMETQYDLAKKNDSPGTYWSFKRIATYIEKNYKKL